MSFLDKIRELFGGFTKEDDHAVVIVKENDTLWGIVKKATGGTDAEIQANVNRVVQMNPDIKDPDVLHVGQELKLPADWVE